MSLRMVWHSVLFFKSLQKKLAFCRNCTLNILNCALFLKLTIYAYICYAAGWWQQIVTHWYWKIRRMNKPPFIVSYVAKTECLYVRCSNTFWLYINLSVSYGRYSPNVSQGVFVLEKLINIGKCPKSVPILIF